MLPNLPPDGAFTPFDPSNTNGLPGMEAGATQLPPPPPPPASQALPNLTRSLEEQERLVALCNEFKKNTIQHASQKKEILRRCYAYVKNQLYDDDLLPVLAAKGKDHDATNQRPQLFLPIARQQAKEKYSEWKLTLFPNDEDYFRCRAKQPYVQHKGAMVDCVALEDYLTEALKYKFKQAMISEKFGPNLYNVIWAGYFCCYPKTQETTQVEWSYQPASIDPITGETINEQYIPNPVQNDPIPDLETLNPLDFYIDPNAKDYESAQWVYLGNKKLHQLMDSPLYFNKELIQAVQKTKRVDENKKGNSVPVSDLLGLASTFEDTEDNYCFDLYYFPYLKTDDFEYRNIIIGIIEEQLIVRLSPNMLPRGVNPVVFCPIQYDPMNPYSQGPVEDIKDIQRTCNFMNNYKIESMSRNGNRWAMTPDVKLEQAFGMAGSIFRAANPKDDVVNLSADYSEISAIDNSLGVLKAEATQLFGTSNPFQGSSEVDYQKTATEINSLEATSRGINRDEIEHIANMGVRPVLERLMYLCADLSSDALQLPVVDEMGRKTFVPVDMSILKTGAFVIEVTSTNPAQGKGAQVASLQKLLAMVLQNPASLPLAEPIIKQIGNLEGIKNIDDLVNQLKERLLGAIQPGIPGPEGPMGANAPPGVGGPPAGPPQ